MPPVKNLTGQKFGRLTVLERVPNISHGKASWSCICECGNKIVTLGNSLVRQKTQSCGCLNTESMDLTGQRFGKLVVLKYVGRDSKRNSQWLCQCDCGNESTTSSLCLRKGDTRSCGCLIGTNSRRIKHGAHDTPEYKAWKNLIQRCENPKIWNYKNYGGRGIKVCNGWRNDFAKFLAVVGLRPSKKHSIDRIDNDGNYSCGQCAECQTNGWALNCKWSTRIEQANNKRRSKPKQLNGHTNDWSESPLFQQEPTP